MVETDLLLGVDAVPVGPAIDALGGDDPGSPTPEATPPRTPTESPPTSPPTRPPTRPTSSRPTITAASATGGDGTAGPLITGLPPQTLTGTNAADRLAAIREHHAAHCPLCRTADDARSIVFGEGHPEADLVFVGEAPGEHEDREGRPFVGPAGELLDRMIGALGLDRSQVYITTVVKTRPRENRTPRPDEAATCGPWLANELLAVRPKAIVALGGTPAKHLLQTSTGITRLRGEWGGCRIADTDFPVLPTFHPAFVLQQYTTEVRAAVWQDLQEAKARTEA